MLLFRITAAFRDYCQARVFFFEGGGGGKEITLWIKWTSKLQKPCIIEREKDRLKEIIKLRF